MINNNIKNIAIYFYSNFVSIINSKIFLKINNIFLKISYFYFVKSIYNEVKEPYIFKVFKILINYQEHIYHLRDLCYF
jgi:hypothetical protein